MQRAQTRFLAAIIVIALIMTGVSLFGLHGVGHAHIDQHMLREARLALEFDHAIRQYVVKEVRPRAIALAPSPIEFVPETMSGSYVARAAFEHVSERFPDLVLHTSSLAPHNPVNLARPEEREIFDYFETNPEASEWHGYLHYDDTSYFAVASVRRHEQGCLQCHGDPADAPESLHGLYPEAGGFHNAVGQIAGIDVVAIPDTSFLECTLGWFGRLGALMALVTVGLFLTLTWLFRCWISRPLATLNRHFIECASVANLSQIHTVPVRGPAEFRELSSGFNVMVNHVRAMSDRLEERVRERTAELSRTITALEAEQAERAHAQAGLLAAQAALDAANDMVIWFDRDGKIVYVNAAVKTMLGYDQESALQQDISLLDRNLNRDELLVLWSQLHDEPAQVRDTEFERSNRTTMVVEVHYSLIETGHCPCVCALARDITMRKQVEESMSRNVMLLEVLNSLRSRCLKAQTVDELLRAALGDVLSIPSLQLENKGVIFLHNPETDCLEMAVQRNLSADIVNLCGTVSRGECLCGLALDTGNPLFRSCVCKDHTVHTEGMIDHGHYVFPIADAETTIGVLCLYLPAGARQCKHEMEMLQAATSIIASGIMRLRQRHLLLESNRRLASGLERERESSRQLAEMMRQLRSAKHHAEAANRAKSAFLANMSHEIRTPLTAILGYADVMLQERQNDPDIKEYAGVIKRSGEHLLSVISDILDVSKIEAGKFTIDQATCSLGDMMGQICSLMQVRATEKGLTLCVNYRWPIPARITTDPVRLRQIVMNLIGNAIKFTDTGGVFVDVSVDPVTSRSHDGPGDDKPGEAILSITVRDTGVGITPENQQRLFQPFSQVDESATRRHGGTGLGLTISKRLAQLLGGDISCSSRPGEGSEFRVTVRIAVARNVRMLRGPEDAEAYPADPSADEQPGPQHETTEPLDGVRILLAEDGPDNQRLIRHILIKNGADVSVAVNGKIACDQALDAMKQGMPYHLILMDMQMPVMDGITAVKLLRQSGYTWPIAALTAHGLSGVRDECRQAGCDDYATKPIDRRDLLDLCRKWVQCTGSRAE